MGVGKGLLSATHLTQIRTAALRSRQRSELNPIPSSHHAFSLLNMTARNPSLFFASKSFCAPAFCIRVAGPGLKSTQVQFGDWKLTLHTGCHALLNPKTLKP